MNRDVEQQVWQRVLGQSEPPRGNLRPMELEAMISVNAAVHLACARNIITKVDLDGPVLCREDPICGGAVFDEKIITVSDAPGLGIQGIDPKYLTYVN